MPDTQTHVTPADVKQGRPLSRAAMLREMLFSPDLRFLMEAHSGLSAKIVEEAGFQGVWGSGLSMSAAMGLRDNNEASWTQVLDQVETMADATRLPILLDGDTGYGNFNNVRRLVRKLGTRGVAGVCLEDKLFPKTNSFLGEAQPLADIEEFCGRIRAGKDAQEDADFCIVARTEALISGHGMDVALRRAEAYHAAGADAVLIHSKRATAAEIVGFMERWDRRCPVVVVPTTYHATPTDTFRRLGVSTVIWANHILRASITAMRAAARQIQEDESTRALEGQVASVKDVFAITGNAELEEASSRYLPASEATNAIVLAAGAAGADLRAATDGLPPCMADIRGKPLLRRLADTLRGAGVREITAVRGWNKAAVSLPGIATIDNDAHATTGEAATLHCALARLRGETVVTYGDVLFRRSILDGLLSAPGDIVLAADSQPRPGANARDLLRAAAPEPLPLDDNPAPLQAIGNLGDDLGGDLGGAAGGANGEWTGLMRLSARGSELVRDELVAMAADGSLPGADLPAVLARLLAHTSVHVHWVRGEWLDVDTLRDLADARNFQ